MVYTEIRFEWDLKKNKTNLQKHGIDFELAITIFDDPFALRVKDEKHSSSLEERLWQIGESDDGILLVVFTIRAKSEIEIYRVISARRAGKKEKELYEINKRVPF